MSLKTGLLFIALLAGSFAFPVEDVEQDMSIFFENADSSARIVGGTVAGAVPYMVSLTSGANVRSLVCGGSLISTSHVLTAAHCITSNLASLRGNVGSNRFASGGTSYAFSRRIIHPDYNGNQIKNDIGILVTAAPVELSSSVALVSLSLDYIEGGIPTIANGWGRTGTYAPVSQVLLELNAVVVDGEECIRRVAERAPQVNVRAPPVDPRVEICAFNSNTRGMCRGDSGSPLMRADSKEQIGIVSWGLPCARGAPDMFARVSAFVPWIEQNTQ